MDISDGFLRLYFNDPCAYIRQVYGDSQKRKNGTLWNDVCVEEVCPYCNIELFLSCLIVPTLSCSNVLSGFHIWGLLVKSGKGERGLHFS